MTSSWSRSATGSAVTGLAELNRLFTAWAETVYHTRPHSRDRAAPAAPVAGRRAVPPPRSPAQLRGGVLVVRAPHGQAKTATVNLHGSIYETDPVLAGRRRRAGLRPVRPDRASRSATTAGPAARRPRSRSAGTPTPKPAPSSPPPPRRRPTGIDYLAIIAAEHHAAQRQPHQLRRPGRRPRRRPAARPATIAEALAGEES